MSPPRVCLHHQSRPAAVGLARTCAREAGRGCSAVPHSWLIILVHSPTQIDQTDLTFLVAHHVSYQDSRRHATIQDAEKDSKHPLMLSNSLYIRTCDLKTIYIRPRHNHAACILVRNYTASTQTHVRIQLTLRSCIVRLNLHNILTIF